MIQTNIQRREFADGEELAQGLADWTAERLRSAIEARGVALLIVSGGKSPARFFDRLSKVELDWTRVAVTLADERRVADDSPRSNARLVRDTLLRNHAEGGQLFAARGCPLAAKIRNSPRQARASPFCRCQQTSSCSEWARMGTRPRGFPAPMGSPRRWIQGHERSSRRSSAAGAGEPRLTLTGRVILRAQAIALEIEGEAKLATFAAALETWPGGRHADPRRAATRGRSAHGVQREARVNQAIFRLTRELIRRTLRRRGPTLSRLHERTPALVERAKGVLGLDRRRRARNSPNRISTPAASSPGRDRSGAACAHRRE